MPLPSLRFRALRVVALALVLALGAAAWFLFLRDTNKPSESEPATDREPKEREPITDDPIVRGLSTEEQVSQVLMLGFDGSSPGDPGVAELGSDPPGAIVVRSDNWRGVDAGKKLVSGLGAKSEIPPIVAVSQEGGEYSSLPDLPPSKRAFDIARAGDADAAEAWAKEASEALAGAGFHLNLFPVADVASLDSPIAGRAFSDDPAVVTELTEAALQGCEAADFACAPLHFPGLGSASQDTAAGPATVVTDLATLTSRDLLPFKAAKDAPAMVLSLAFYPDFDAVVPGALTPGVATGLLREDLGFKGVAISDDLSAGAVQATYSTPDAAVAALGAGTDLIQISSPEDADGVAKALIDAVDSGTIQPERLAEAAERVIELKRDLGLIED